MERQEAIGIALRKKYEELSSIRESSNWGRKMAASGYMKHRVGYSGTRVADVKTYDSTPRVYMEKYESGLCGYLTPQDDEWARLVPRKGRGLEDSSRDFYGSSLDERKNLDMVSGWVFSELADTNFYTSLYNASMDRDILGIGYMYVIDGYDNGVGSVVYRCLDPQECVIADSWLGICNVFIRKCEMSAVDLVSWYPGARLERTREFLKANSERQEIEVYEAVLPYDYLRDEDGEVIPTGNGNRYSHIVYVDLDREVVEESGYKEMPIAVTRRNQDSEKMPYGCSLAEDCLEEIRKLNDMANMRERMLQLNANPPMLVPPSLRGNYSGAKPGKMYYGTESPTPIITNIDSRSILNDIQDLRAVLRGLIPVDLFETIMGSTDTRKTATEVSMKKNEAMILLSFQIENVKRDLLEPVFKRTAKVCIRHLEGVDEKRKNELLELVDNSRLELNSVFVRRLQAYLQNVGDDEIFSAIANMSQIYPQVLDIIDLDKYSEKWLVGKGLLPELLNSKQKINATRDKRAELQSQQFNAQVGEQNAKANSLNAKAGQLGGM